MRYRDYHSAFGEFLSAKSEPNDRERALFAKARKYIRYLSYVPGIRMVAVVNSLSYYGTHEDSDIDLFIITQKDRLSFVRFFATMIFFLFGVWRKGDAIKGQFCLSFFMDDHNLDLGRMAIDRDIYLEYWISVMKPILADFFIISEFEAANNLRDPLSQSYLLSDRPRSAPKWLDLILSLLDREIGAWMRRRASKTHERLGSPNGVVIDEHIYKFHDQDRRVEYRDQFTKKYKINLTNIKSM